MNIGLTPRSINNAVGIACMPLRSNVPKPRQQDWKLTICPVCGCECWESELTRRIIKKGADAACNMCALRTGILK